MTHDEQINRQPQITDKVLGLLEWLDEKCPDQPTQTFLCKDFDKEFTKELRRRIDEIKLESFAQVELNKCDHTRLISALGDDFATCLDCGKEINEPLK